MTRIKLYIVIFLILPSMSAYLTAQDTLIFKGQLSGWLLYNSSNELPLYSGGRYLPQLNYNINLKNGNLIDFEGSANLYGLAGARLFDSIDVNGDIKPYRLWARYSSDQFELRLGLQKINFGSASMLRPLMWFDQVDPRDPLRFTDGVWGLLGRYYFLNNTNIWFWALYGNNKQRGWEPVPTNSKYPEIGGRVQLPVPYGEAGLSYNYRVADSRDLDTTIPVFSEISENKIGFDLKLDLLLGFWLESSVALKNSDLGMFKNQEIYNVGIDYTFGIGNGLYIVFEQILASYNEKAFSFDNTSSFSLLSLSYPVGIFDNLSGIVYYDWENNKSYNFISWQHSYNNLSLYCMAFWNPDKYNIPGQQTESLMAGKGVQVMLVYNH